MSTCISRKLASFAVSFAPQGLPQEIRREVQRAIVNGFAAGLGGSSDHAISILYETMSRFAGTDTSTVIGQTMQTDAATAAFINAAAINVLDFDDTHDKTIIHPTAPIAAAVLALAEMTGATGAEAIDAIAIGIETACRIGNAVSPGHYSRGWHITATCGVFGAAMGCGRLMRLREKDALYALGAASAQSSGLVETLGTMAKSVGVGHAARAGLLSALLARDGFTGPKRPLEGRLGFLRVTADQPVQDRILDGLGSDWELHRNMYKPYPCGVVLNPVIDACLTLRSKPRFALTDIKRIDVFGSELLRMRADRPEVTTGREAQVSAQHAAAVTLLRGSASPADFSDEAVNDKAVLSLRSKIAPIIVDHTIAESGARLEIHFTSGEVMSEIVTKARGSLDNPVSDLDLVTKLHNLAAYGAPWVQVEQLLETIGQLPKADSVKYFMSCLRPS